IAATWLFDRAHTPEEFRRRTKPIPIVIQQCMLSGQATFSLIKFGDTAGSHDEGLEQGGLPIFVQVGRQIGNRRGEIPAETREVFLVSTPGGGNYHAIRTGQLGEKWTAGGSAIDDHYWTPKRLQPRGQLRR